jgi:DNA-binding response OmpR family regulator
VPSNVRLLRARLQSDYYQTEVAPDGFRALELARDWQPDLILLDIMMPRISGFEVCKRLRADPVRRDVGVLMVTALDEPADIERAVEVGTDDFLTKPIDKRELLLRVRSLLKARRYKQQLDRALAYIAAIEKGGT